VTTTSIRPESAHVLTPAARVCLKPFSQHPGMVNGAWWPRSRDLTRELPPLIALLDQSWGQIHRLTVNVRMWPDIPRKVRTGSHTVRLGWYDAEQDPHDLCLISHTKAPGRWDLLVVPPETEPERAKQLMAAASSPGNHQTASALLASALDASPSGPSWDRARIRDWESEGGLTATSR